MILVFGKNSLLKSGRRKNGITEPTKFWHQHLVGSVIPFLRLPDFKREFFPKTKIIMEEHEQHVKHVAALKLLEQKEQQFHENINLINDMRKVILHRYCK